MKGVLLDEDSSAIDGCKFYSKLQIKFNYINNKIEKAACYMIIWDVPLEIMEASITYTIDVNMSCILIM